jgi:hypothetical protein
MKSLKFMIFITTFILFFVHSGYLETFNITSLEKFWKGAYSASLVNEYSKTESGFQNELLVKADPDECYKGVGKDTPYDPNTCTDGIPRVNESYPWSMAISENNLWFSTFTNPVCGVLSARGIYIPIVNNHPKDGGVKICEMGRDNYKTPIGTSRQNWRPPHIYKYDIKNNKLYEVTPKEDIIYRTLGIRSAVVYDGLVFFLGLQQRPAMNTNPKNRTNEPGLIMYVYDEPTGKYLGHKILKEYNSSRSWLATDKGLYVIVNKARTRTIGGNSNTSSVLRWVGDKRNLYKFETVGEMRANITNMAFHENRIFVNTWPSMDKLRLKGTEIYMSPELTGNGLTAADANKWQKVWSITDYEPDKATSETYAGGAMRSYKGYLYWGTMNIPFTSLGGHLLSYGILPDDLIIGFLASFRPISIFRGKDFGTPNQKVEVLYGFDKMPVYKPPLSKGNPLPIGQWSFEKNKTGRPLYGQAGFGNPLNSYTWSMAVYDDKLFIGTMDYAYQLAVDVNTSLRKVLALIFRDVPSIFDINTEYLPFKDSFDYGADLYYFKDNNSPAVAVTKRGFGNYSNFGIRTMSANDTGLYIGISNQFNLLTDPNDNNPEGGFEIRRITTLPEE